MHALSWFDKANSWLDQYFPGNHLEGQYSQSKFNDKNMQDLVTRNAEYSSITIA